MLAVGMNIWIVYGRGDSVGPGVDKTTGEPDPSAATGYIKKIRIRIKARGLQLTGRAIRSPYCNLSTISREEGDGPAAFAANIFFHKPDTVFF